MVSHVGSTEVWHAPSEGGNGAGDQVVLNEKGVLSFDFKLRGWDSRGDEEVAELQEKYSREKERKREEVMKRTRCPLTTLFHRLDK